MLLHGQVSDYVVEIIVTNIAAGFGMPPGAVNVTLSAGRPGSVIVNARVTCSSEEQAAEINALVGAMDAESASRIFALPVEAASAQLVTSSNGPGMTPDTLTMTLCILIFSPLVVLLIAIGFSRWRSKAEPLLKSYKPSEMVAVTKNSDSKAVVGTPSARKVDKENEKDADDADLVTAKV